MKEAEIIINGRKLSHAESMTLRVAISHFASDMREVGVLGLDEVGEGIRLGYFKNASEIERFIVESINKI